MSNWNVTIEEDPETGEVILPISDELMRQMQWAEGDELVWEASDLGVCGEYPGQNIFLTLRKIK